MEDICVCSHHYEEHDDGQECDEADCLCVYYERDGDDDPDT